ncbi:MAG: FlaA1/EpsC-like NDP-sugar epimerase, partial [Bacteroidia bacterium]
MNRKLQTFKYLLFDFLTASAAWSLFFYYRKVYVESQIFGVKVMVNMDERFIQGLILIPLFWVLVYAILGNYRKVYRKSRLKEFFQTFVTSLVGVTSLFFALILDDEVENHTTYYQSFGVLFGLHFGLTFIFRFFLSSITAHQIHGRKIGFPTLMIGSNAKAVELYLDLENQRQASGNL